MTNLAERHDTARNRSFVAALQRARYHPLISSILYGVGSPVRSLADTVGRQIARKVRLNGGEVNYDGIHLHFPRNVGPGYLSNITWYGEAGFEPDTWRVLKMYLEGAGTFFDIGANIGFYTVLAHHIAPTAKILSFEPVPKIQAEARRFLAANGAADTICPVALSDHDGTATLYQPIDDHDIAESSASTLVQNSWQARKDHTEISVEAIRLDTFLAGRDLARPVVAKIDVEDYEAAVLRGAADVIARYRPIIVCEILPRAHANRETVEVLDRFDYASYAITPKGCFKFGPADFARERLFTDFLLIPREKIDSAIFFIPHGWRPIL